jgi:hypothetical protein
MLYICRVGVQNPLVLHTFCISAYARPPHSSQAVTRVETAHSHPRACASAALTDASHQARFFHTMQLTMFATTQKKVTRSLNGSARALPRSPAIHYPELLVDPVSIFQPRNGQGAIVKLKKIIVFPLRSALLSLALCICIAQQFSTMRALIA